MSSGPLFCSRRVALCLRAPIRYALTEDEQAFIRAGIVGALPPGTTMAPDEVDHAVLEFSKRLTVAQYRVLRDGVRQFRETIAANAQLSAVYPPGTKLGDLLPALPIRQ